MKVKLKKLMCMLLVLSTLGAHIGLIKAADHFTVCIDPGHQAKGDPKGEPIAPGSGNKKARVSSGTSGVGTKNPEYKINLEAGMILKKLLEEKGYTVVMTREKDEVNISNVERAQIANEAKADMTVRLHCDSIDNSGKSGAVLIVPSQKSKYTSSIYGSSQKYAAFLKTALQNKGVKVNGIFERADMTGFNWSEVPVVIFEMGFMSNWTEDKMLADKAYQQKLMEAVVEAMDNYKEAIKTKNAE